MAQLKTKPIPTFRAIQDSVGSKLVIVLVDEDDAALDVSSGASVEFSFRRQVDGIWTSVSRDAAGSWTTDGSEGSVEYEWTTTELANAGKIQGSIKIVDYAGADEHLISSRFWVDIEERARVAP